MRTSEIWTWVLIALLLLFLWNSSTELFQDTIKDASGNSRLAPAHGPPYSASDATKIVGMMPSTMVTALKTNVTSGSDSPSALLNGPISQIMTHFWANVYSPATVPLTSADVDTFLTTESLPNYLTKADVKTLLVAYFVAQQHGDANVASTAAQQAANAVAAAHATTTASNAADYNALLFRQTGQTGGTTTPGWTMGGIAGPTGSTSSWSAGATGSTSSWSAGATGPAGPVGAATTLSSSPICPTGTAFDSSAGTCKGGPTGPAPQATCSPGYTMYSSHTGTGGPQLWGCVPTSSIGPTPPTSYSAFGAPQGSNALTPWGTVPGEISGSSSLSVGGPTFGGFGSSQLASSSSSWSSIGSNYPTLLGPASTKPNLPNSNASGAALSLPTPAQVGADSNSVYAPGSRVPVSKDSWFFSSPLMSIKMDGDPLGFSPDYSMFMR